MRTSQSALSWGLARWRTWRMVRDSGGTIARYRLHIRSVVYADIGWAFGFRWIRFFALSSECQGYGNPQGYIAGVRRGRGRGMIFETPGIPLPLLGGIRVWEGYEYLIFFMKYFIFLASSSAFWVGVPGACQYCSVCWRKSQKLMIMMQSTHILI